MGMTMTVITVTVVLANIRIWIKNNNHMSWTTKTMIATLNTHFLFMVCEATILAHILLGVHICVRVSVSICMFAASCSIFHLDCWCRFNIAEKWLLLVLQQLPQRTHTCSYCMNVWTLTRGMQQSFHWSSSAEIQW